MKYNKIKIYRIKEFRYDSEPQLVGGFYHFRLSGKLLSGSRFRDICFRLTAEDFSKLRDKRLESIGI